MKNSPQALFSQAAPVGRAGKTIQSPLVRFLIAVGFLIPVFILNRGYKAALVPLIPKSLLIPGRYLSTALFFALFLLAYVLYTRYIEKRSASEIFKSGWLEETSLGFLTAFVLVGVVVFVLAVTGCFSISGVVGNKRLVLDLFVKFFMGAFFEELIFRLVFFKLTEELLGTWIALLIQCLFFGFAHQFNDNATLFTSLAVTVVGGFIYTAGYIHARSLWLPLGLHWGWNFSQSGIFSMPNSGTPYQGLFLNKISGPGWLTGRAWGIEATCLAVFLCFIAGTAFVVFARKNSRIVLPLWKRKKNA